MQIKQSPDHK